MALFADSPPVWWQVTSDILIIFGTISVAVLAIWGEQVRNWLAAPRISIEPHNLTGKKIHDSNGRLMIFYFLKVVNRRRWATARGVRVVLKRIDRRGPDHNFHPDGEPVPYQFCWSPSETEPVLQTITDQKVVDLGWLSAPDQTGQSVFQPKMYSWPHRPDFHVRNGEAVRYHLEVQGDNFYCTKPTVVEVAWDGQFTDDLNELQKHLRITMI